MKTLLQASEKGELETVNMLLQQGEDINLVDEKGDNALILASTFGHHKVVELLIKKGVDINHVKTDGCDALMIASQNGKAKTFKLLLFRQKNPQDIYLSHALCIAFENGHRQIVEILSTFLDNTGGMEFCKTLCYLLMQNIESKSGMLEIILSTPKNSTKKILQDVKMPLSCYIDLVCGERLKQSQDCDGLLQLASKIMPELSSMKDFNEFKFFICQRTLKKVYTTIRDVDKENWRAKIVDLFDCLVKHDYAANTLSHLRKGNLLDTSTTEFSLSLIHDTLYLFVNGSDKNLEFAKQLAEKNVVEMFNEHFITHKHEKSSQSQNIHRKMIIILFNIARRKELKQFDYFQSLKITLKKLKFEDAFVSLIAKMTLSLIVDDSDTIILTRGEMETVVAYLKEACKVPEKRVMGIHRSELLQALAKFAKHHETCKAIIPLLDTLMHVLDEEDLEEIQHTTECLKEMCRNQEASQQIITNQELTWKLANKFDKSGNSDIDQNINDIFWIGGRLTGIMPNMSGKVVSDEFPKNFEIKADAIGKGAFGSVHLITDTERPDERKFVAKRLCFGSLQEMGHFQREAEILLKTKHPRIVQFHGFMKQDDTFFIFLEYLKQGTLAAFVANRGFLEENMTRQFTIQILEGVQYLHQENILHRDIKGSNILMVDDSAVKLTDFGISVFMDGNALATVEGTVRYMAPELIKEEGGKITNYTPRADIWSVGCTVVEMLTGKPPNSSLDTPKCLFATASGGLPRYQLPETSSVHLQEFLKRCFTIEQKDRPTADWLLKNNPFLTKPTTSVESIGKLKLSQDVSNNK